MGCASEAGVVGAECDFDFVEDTAVDFAVVDEAFGGVADAHADGGVIVGCGDDHVDVFDHGVWGEGVVVDEGAACCFDDADAFGGCAGLVADVGAGDFGVGDEFKGAFGSVE